MRTKFVFSLGVSYNQPKLCSNALWASNGTTFANSSIISKGSYALFVDSNNTLYTTDQHKQGILVWSEGSTKPTRILNGNFEDVTSLFVTVNGDIYVGNHFDRYRVNKWVVNSTYSVLVMYVDAPCVALFVDTDDGLYCSMFQNHRVVKTLLNENSNISITVGGNGQPGSASDQLYHPYGIIDDINFDLYVSDFGNRRIQLFRYGQLHGITVASDKGSLIISLNAPSWMTFDAEMYMFIADNKKHQVVGSSRDGVRCLVGCSGEAGSASYQLNEPSVFAFDSYGNIYVTDFNNNRIQKFTFISTSCSKYNKLTGTMISLVFQLNLHHLIFLHQLAMILHLPVSLVSSSSLHVRC